MVQSCQTLILQVAAVLLILRLLSLLNEMGHVAALHRLGIAASAPMFIPGLGAFVRMKQAPSSPHEDARVGLAGPIWGLGAAVITYLLFVATGMPLIAAIAHVGAWINLFNLLPVWQLDGGRGFNAMTRKQRWYVTATIGVMWLLTSESLLLLLLVIAGTRAVMGRAPQEPDRYALFTFCLLVIALSWMTLIEVPELKV